MSGHDWEAPGLFVPCDIKIILKSGYDMVSIHWRCRHVTLQELLSEGGSVASSDGGPSENRPLTDFNSNSGVC